MEIIPIYSDMISYLVIDVKSFVDTATASSHKQQQNKGKSASSMVTKYELFDLFQPLSNSSSSSSSTAHSTSVPVPPLSHPSHPIINAMSLTLLNNQQLLQESLPMTFEFLPSSILSPFSSTSSGSSSSFLSSSNSQSQHQQLEYVILPYEIGKSIYSYFDILSSQFSSILYKRELYVVFNTASEELLKNPRHDLTTTVNYFTNNFSIPFSLFLDLYQYFTLPVYTTTSTGLASVEPIDATFSYRELKETITLKQLIKLLVKRYSGHTIRDVEEERDGGDGEDAGEDDVDAFEKEKRKKNTVEASWRLWILYPITSTTTTANGKATEDQPQRSAPSPFSQYSSRVLYNSSYEWILLTEHSKDYQKECHQLLWNLFPSNNSLGNGSNNGSKRLSSERAKERGGGGGIISQKEILGIMIEGISCDGHWPSDNILAFQLYKNISVLSDEEEATALAAAGIKTKDKKDGFGKSPRVTNGLLPVVMEGNGSNKGGGDAAAANDGKTLRIGLLVDILTKNNCWKIGEICNIAKVDNFNEYNQAKRKILLTIRCPPVLSATAGSSVSVPLLEEIYELPLESPRLLCAGTLTDVYSLHSLPSLLLEETFLYEKVLLALQASSTFYQIVSNSQRLLLLQTSATVPSSSDAAEITEEGKKAENFSSTTTSAIPTTPSAARSVGSVVPINVSFTPDSRMKESQDMSSSQVYSTPRKGGGVGMKRNPSDGQLPSTSAISIRPVEELIKGLTCEDLDNIPLEIFYYLMTSSTSEEKERENGSSTTTEVEDGNTYRLYYYLRLSKELLIDEVSNAQQLTIYYHHRYSLAFHENSLSLSSLYYYPTSLQHRGGAKKNDFSTSSYLLASSSQSGKQQNPSGTGGGPVFASPGKQLLSQWDRLFSGQQPGGGGGGGNNTSNNNLIPPSAGSARNSVKVDMDPSLQQLALKGGNKQLLSISQPNMKRQGSNTSVEKIPSGILTIEKPPNSRQTTANDDASMFGPLPIKPLTIQNPSFTASSSQLQQQQQQQPATYNATITRVGIIGLNNLGNTCFLASSLQCLLRSPVFIPYFLSYQYKFDINSRSKFGTHGKLTEEFAEFVRMVYNPSVSNPSHHHHGRGAGRAGTGGNDGDQGNDGKGGGTMSAASGGGSYYYFGGKKGSGSVPAGSSGTGSGIAALVNSAFNKGKSSSNLSSHVSHHHSNFARIAISPITLYKTFQGHKTQFVGADQQDAQEFLSELLDTFHEDLKSSFTDNSNTSGKKVIFFFLLVVGLL
jgi:hypothetical protein